MTRSPLKNPQPSDVLRWQDWRITVLSREGDSVRYRAAHKDGRTKPDALCTLAEWGERAKGARVAEKALSDAECVATSNVAALCEVDGKPIVGETHCVGLKFFCADHCAVNHKSKEKQHVAA